MKLVDTCVWIEALADTPTGRRYKTLLAQPHKLLVSTVNIYELRKWLTRSLDSETADEVMVAVMSAQVVAPDAATALHAAELSAAFDLHAIDALIYATALSHNVELVTCDAHFKGMPQVDYAAKVARAT